MKKSLLFTFFCFIVLFSSCKLSKSGAKASQRKSEIKILMITTMGDIKLKLYNETPLHRDNFIKLVKNHTYDGLLFHRVIQKFMIQGGDPQSKNAPAGTALGEGDLGYTIPAEFNPQLIHKKGVLAAARNGDDVNPKRESSASQFYIVQGKVFTDADLNKYEERINREKKNQIFSQIIQKPENAVVFKKFIEFQQQGKADSLQFISQKFEPQVQAEYEKQVPFKFSEEQRIIYKTIGGAPHLDTGYTVYGEVLEGLDVVDKIAAVKVDAAARPFEDVKILKVEIIK